MTIEIVAQEQEKMASGRNPIFLSLGDELDGEEVLPGFKLKLSTFFK